MTLKVLIVGMIVMGFGFALSSCSKEEPPKKAAQNVPPGHQKMAEEYKKGLEESKKFVAAKVNGADITMFSLIAEMNRIAPEFIKPGQRRDPETDAKVKQRALNNLIFKELAVQEAVRQGIEMKPDMIEDAVKKLKAQLGSDEAYRKYLQDSGLTEDSLRKVIERNYRFQTILGKEVSGKMKVSDKTLRETYEKEKNDLMTNDNPPRQMTFEEAKGLLEREIRAEKGQEIITAWEKDLRKKAKIEISLAEVEKRLKEEGAKRQNK